MKSITHITDEQIRKYSSERTLRVYEKLDMVYFKIHFENDGYYATTPKGKAIGDVDIVVNSVYKDIDGFLSRIDGMSIYRKLGRCEIGMFYLPVHKTRIIEYSNIKEGTFVFSDCQIHDGVFPGYEDFIRSVVGDDVLGFGEFPGPYIGEIYLGDWFDRNMDQKDMASRILSTIGSGPFSGNSPESIEGLVLRDGKRAFCVSVTDTIPVIDPTTKLIYRDTIIKNFVHTVPSNVLESILSGEGGYFDKIYSLFFEYVNSTDIFSTMAFDDDDLLPPIVGYIGDVSYDDMPPVVAMTCRNSTLFKNVLRILLTAFDVEPGSGRFDRFEPEERRVLEEIVERCR